MYIRDLVLAAPGNLPSSVPAALSTCGRTLHHNFVTGSRLSAISRFSTCRVVRCVAAVFYAALIAPDPIAHDREVDAAEPVSRAFLFR